MEKQYFYTVLFYIVKDGQNFFVHPVTGTRENLEKVSSDLQSDASVQSCFAVYQSSFSIMDSSPFVVKKLEKKEDK